MLCPVSYRLSEVHHRGSDIEGLFKIPIPVEKLRSDNDQLSGLLSEVHDIVSVVQLHWRKEYKISLFLVSFLHFMIPPLLNV